MGTARKMVQRVRINVDELLYLLSRCAVRELEIFYYYTIFSHQLIDGGEVRLRDAVEKARTEDRNHFERLVGYISEMGGEFPFDFRKFPEPSIYSKSAQWELSDERMMLKVINEAEIYVARIYMNICHLTKEKDNQTYQLISSLLEEEFRHGRALRSFLSTPQDRPSKKRGLLPNSPSLLSFCFSGFNLRLFQGKQIK